MKTLFLLSDWHFKTQWFFFSMVKTLIEWKYLPSHSLFSVKELDSLWFGFLVRALVSLAQNAVEALFEAMCHCSVVLEMWLAQAHTHIYINKLFYIWELWISLWIFLCSSTVPQCQWPVKMIKICCDRISVCTLSSSVMLSLHTQCATSSGMDLCVSILLREIVLFLSEGPLIFYYTIKSMCSTHKQLEIKWAPLKGLCVCLHVCELSACQQKLKTGRL